MTRAYPEPLPGDFDEELRELDPADVQIVESSREPHLSVQFTLEGDDAAALQQIADDQGARPARLSGR